MLYAYVHFVNRITSLDKFILLLPPFVNQTLQSLHIKGRAQTKNVRYLLLTYINSSFLNGFRKCFILSLFTKMETEIDA